MTPPPSLQTLLDVADKLMDGELQARTGLGSDDSDTGRLAKTLDHLADSLQAHRRHIEQITRQHRRSMRAHRVLSASNRALLRAKDESDELKEVCRLIVDVGSYPFAWIGYIGQDEHKRIRPVAHHGLDGHFLQEMAITWADTGLGMGASDTAIRTGEPVVVRDVLADERVTPWLTMAKQHGLHSVLALPLQLEGQVAGVLVICAAEPDAFDEHEIALLCETADDLTFAIETVRARQLQLKTEAAYRRVSQQHSLILQAAAEGIYVVDTAGIIQFVNPAANAMFGYDADELLGRNAHDAVHHTLPNGQTYAPESCPISAAIMLGTTIQRVQDTFWRKDGTPVPVEVSSTPIFVGDTLQGAVVMVNDISERARYMAQLERKSNFDELTGLPNRNLLNDRLMQAIDRCREENHLLALLVVNLNHFRNIIDGLGHSTGDRVLQEVAAALHALESSTDTVARVGGDEFVWVLEIAQEDQAATAAYRALEALAHPLDIDGREVFVSASIGIGIYPRDGGDTETLLKNATTAMHRAKKAEGHRFSFYATEMNARSLERLDMESALRRALDNDELVLYYQPQLSLRSGEIYGAEALLRWKHPQRGMVSPVEFIPLAETSGMIAALGEWALRDACRQNKAWQDAGLDNITVAVNMSARQLDAQDIAGLADNVLRDTRMDPRFLELELTESMIMSDPGAFILATRKLKDMGISLSVDDFGTGYSSLNYLKRFAIDRLKIDQSFVRDIIHEPNAAAITLAIMALARSLRLSTIAEGVETAEQLNFLRARGCDEMQGYYFSRPLPAADFELLLRSQHRLAFPTTHHAPHYTLILAGLEPTLAAALEPLLRREGYIVMIADNCVDALNMLISNEVGVVIAGVRVLPGSGPDFLARVREIHPETLRMMLAGEDNLHTVAEAVNKGEIYKFLSVPWQDDTLVKTIRTAFHHYETQSRKENR